MLTRLVSSALVFFVLMADAQIVSARDIRPKDTIRFTLDYTTIYGGLRTAVPPDRKAMPSIGVALAGGGARAAASLGVLKVLHKEGIGVSAISGTSMGAIIGGLYAAGYSPDEIERIFLSNDWNDLFRDTPSRTFQTREQKETGSRHLLEFSFIGGRFMPPVGLSAGQKLANLLQIRTLAASFEARQDFDRLPIRFRAVATNLETGEAEAIGKGLLQDAIRASAAIPFVFQPIDIGGKLYVDGGMSKNLPVDVVKAMDAEIVIAIDPSARPQRKERLRTLFDIMDQSVTLQVQKETRHQAALADIVISPDTSAYSFTDFPEMQKIIRIGEEAAIAAMPRIREEIRKKTVRTDKEIYVITGLSVYGNRATPEEAIRKAFAQCINEHGVTAGDLRQCLFDVYRLGPFSDVSLDLEPEARGYRGRLSVLESPVVTAIEISGNNFIPSSDVISALKDQTGRPLDVMNVRQALEDFIDRWRGQGYPLVRIDRAEMVGSVLHITLFEGRVESINITGQKRTRHSMIKRQMRTEPGRLLNINTLGEDMQRLYALGFFESLNLDIAESRTGSVVLTLKIKEKPRGTVRLGMRFDLDDAFTGLTDISVDNITGRGIRLYLNTRYGNYTDIALGYHSPVLLRASFVHNIEGFYKRRNYFIYEGGDKTAEIEVARTGLDVSFGYEWFRLGDTYIRYRYESAEMDTVFGIQADEKSKIGSLAVLSTIDTLDSHPFSHKGFLFKGSYETAADTYGGEQNFRKTSLLGQANIPLAERHTLILEAALGLGSGDIPFYEKFGLGGADYLISYPLSGYHRREFSGSNMLGFTTTYRWKLADYQLKFARALYLNISAQTANVWEARDEMATRDLRKAGGIGLHADTLIGPVRLDLGMGEGGRFQVYFSAGLDF